MKHFPRSWWMIGGAAAFVGTVEVTRDLFGLPMALLLCAGVLLVAVVVLMWHSLQALAGDDAMSLEEALTLAAPVAEEEQKRAVLRALKDLEFERHVGKVRDEDYAVLAARYRGEARTLLGQLDARYEPARERIAAELETALREDDGDHAADLANVDGKKSGTAPSTTSEKTTKHKKGSRKRQPKADDAAKRPRPTRACRRCGTRNVLNIRECKNCGEALAAEKERLCRACPASYDGSLSACPNCGVPAEDS